MRVAICDDDLIIREMVSRCLLLYSKKYKCDIEMGTFTSGEELLEYSGTFDIIFLDIVMKGIDGIETAAQLRKRGKHTKIIFLTSHQERFKECFKVQAFRFMTKPLSIVEFEEYLNDARNENTWDKELSFRKNGVEVSISMFKILYISAQCGYTEVWTAKDMYRSKKSLCDWEEILDEVFFYRCHKKYIVNVSYIEDIGNYVMMKNGERIQSSRRKFPELKRRIINMDLLT